MREMDRPNPEKERPTVPRRFGLYSKLYDHIGSYHWLPAPGTLVGPAAIVSFHEELHAEKDPMALPHDHVGIANSKIRAGFDKAVSAEEKRHSAEPIRWTEKESK